MNHNDPTKMLNCMPCGHRFPKPDSGKTVCPNCGGTTDFLAAHALTPNVRGF